ncbi:MFS transporter-like protein [Thozetella sp. PMI_491]|nr:MFS transporter-like protein [Thozetella sp. PMI_491]
MTFGILDVASGAHPSGTSIIQDTPPSGESMKRIVLVPSPSKSPEDPLNWTRLKKEVLFATILLGSCATGSLGPVLVPGFADVAVYLQVGLTSVTLLNGSLVMALGVSAYLCSCFAEIYGKRLVYIFTTVLLLVSCCWAAASNSYGSLVASRVFQGLGMGAFFALAGTDSINDIFFIHERGFRVGLWNFGIIVSVNLTPVISGYIISGLSWRWSFWVEAILFGLLLGAVLFCFPETTFQRSKQNESVIEGTPPEQAEWEAGEKVNDDTGVSVAHEPEIGLNQTQGSSPLSMVLGRNSLRIQKQHGLMGSFLAPVPLLLHPIVIWGCLMWSVTFTWTILLGAVVSQIFAAPPYSMSTVAIGNLSGIAPFVGSALGTIVGGWFCDLLARSLASRNKGIYEPEFRLLVIIPATIAMAVGTFGLGAVVREELSYNVCGVFLAIINLAVGMGCTGIVSYTNDVCADKAGEAFGLAMVIKSAFAFGLTFFLNDYLARIGPLAFFSTFGAVTVGVMLTTVPLYVFGKRLRAWGDQQDLFHRKASS